MKLAIDAGADLRSLLVHEGWTDEEAQNIIAAVD